MAKSKSEKLRLRDMDGPTQALVLRSLMYLGEHGFHAQTIADTFMNAGIYMSKSMVYAHGKNLGISLRAYRDGRTETAKRVIAKAPILCAQKRRRRKRVA